MKHQFKAILFDMDGVLVDSMGSLAQAWTTACNLLGIEPDQADMYRREGEQEEKSARYFIKNAGLMVTKARIRELLRVKDEEFERMPTPKLFPGAVDVVKAFSNAGFRTAIVTGSLRAHFELMIPGEILEAIDASICGDEVIHGKPNPEPYLKGILDLGVKPAEAVVIENAPYGIESAKAAGAHVIAVRSYLGDEDLPGAEGFVDDIRDLPDVFGLL